MIVISANQLTKLYGVDEILKDVSFHINAGDRVGIVGANGAGNSTLLNILSGELTCDSGNYFISGDLRIGYFHQNDLQQCIADICTMQKKAVLNVVDAYRIMKTNGPRGRSASDVVLAKGLFVSPDIVAVDTAAAKFFNQVREMPLDTVGHLAKGEALKVGTMNLDKLNVKRIKL